MAERFSGRCACGGIRFVSTQSRSSLSTVIVAIVSGLTAPVQPQACWLRKFFLVFQRALKVRHVQRSDNLELIVEHLEQHLARPCSYAVKYHRSFVSAALTMRLTGWCRSIAAGGANLLEATIRLV
jgi:hypothetical protein